ncbi:MAG: HDOD domain-containing protein [Gammaproteobacteria bacterium]|nr:HDOD domain-containing protein [Gammaproteobacteria bacterium]MBU1414121.1 HDOD domain-containing protein [Gammaproteobacteria bacterium]
MGLLRFLRNLIPQWFESSEPVDIPMDRRRIPDDIVQPEPRTLGTNADGTGHSFVRRDAIVNRAEQVAGYEFSLVTRLKARMTRRGGLAARAYDVALLTRLELHRAASLLGSRLALVCLSIESLDNEAIDRLPQDNTVLIFDAHTQQGGWEAMTAGLARLQEKGFRVGIRVAAAADAECPLVAAVDFVLVDVTAFNGLDLRTLARKLKAARTDGGTPPRLLAADVQSDDDYQLCYKCGFDLFQGPFAANFDNLRPTRNTINRAAALSILNMLRTDQSFAAVANELKNEPTLSYKLLRYLNSAAVSLQKPVDNLTEALVHLGRNKFYRWTSLLLFDFEKPGYQEHVLSERALTRGRTLELLAGKGTIPSLPEQLFLIGLFSLLDKALGRPLPELVEKAALPATVRDALLGRPGPCTDALTLVTLEMNPEVPVNQLDGALSACGIDDETYAPIAIEALIWADQVLSESAA